MPQRKAAQRGVVLLVVLGTIITVMFLAGAVLTVIVNNSRLSHHQIERIKAYYAGKAMMNYTLDEIRTGNWSIDDTLNKYACHRDCSGLGVASPDFDISDDPDIRYNVLVTIYPKNKALSNTVTQLDVKTDYIYTP